MLGIRSIVALLLVAPSLSKSEEAASLLGARRVIQTPVDPSKKDAQGILEVWCYRFCGLEIPRPHNPYASDVDCDVPWEHPSKHVAANCDKYCKRSDKWTEIKGKKCTAGIIGTLHSADLDHAKTWCEEMTEDVVQSDGSVRTKPSCGSIQQKPGTTYWEAVDIKVNENTFVQTCTDEPGWDAYVFTGDGSCMRRKNSGGGGNGGSLLDELCGSRGDGTATFTDFWLQVKLYCSSACRPNPAENNACELNTNRLDFVGVAGGTNVASGNDNCAEYCADAADGTGKCMISATPADLCP